MRRVFVAAFLIAAALAHADWTVLKGPTFSVELPDKAGQQPISSNTNGVAVHGMTYMAQGHGALGLLTTTDFPTNLRATDVQKYIKLYLNSFIASAKAHETSRRPITIHGYSGQEARFKIGTQIGTVWAFVVGKEGYGLACMVPGKDLDTIRGRIFNSFRARTPLGALGGQ